MLGFWPEGIEKNASDEILSIDTEMSAEYVGQIAAMPKVAASLDMPADWPRQFNGTDEEMKAYRSVVSDVWNEYEQVFCFEMLGADWSNGSCYFDFRPKMYDGTYLDKIVRATFRISNHDSNTWSQNWVGDKLRMSFVLNGYDIKSVDEYMQQIRNIGNELFNGITDSLPIWRR